MARRRRNTIEILPSARRLVGSLRDLGYQPTEAVADLVDNSIAADAREIDITLAFEGSDSWIRIADDGVGMNGAAVNEAMRYGAERDYDEDHQADLIVVDGRAAWSKGPAAQPLPHTGRL